VSGDGLALRSDAGPQGIHGIDRAAHLYNMSASSLPAKYGESSLSLLNHLIAWGHHVADSRESRDLGPNPNRSCTVASTTPYTTQSAHLRATT